MNIFRIRIVQVYVVVLAIAVTGAVALIYLVAAQSNNRHVIKTDKTPEVAAVANKTPSHKTKLQTPDSEPKSTPSMLYPPDSTESSKGIFRSSCKYFRSKQVDPIVNPGPSGTFSHHLHDFFGNTTTDSHSTYESMIASETTCKSASDTAAYWTPALYDADGSKVNPIRAFVYYRNRPIKYGSTIPFPKDFRMIFGGVGTSHEYYWWGCDKLRTKYYSMPNCSPTKKLKFVINAPNCWDGESIDSTDHRSHVVYAVGNSIAACPRSHPFKLPELSFRVTYPDGSGGSGWKFADGTRTPHADFWNTWDQSNLEELVKECNAASVNCRLIKR